MYLNKIFLILLILFLTNISCSKKVMIMESGLVKNYQQEIADFRLKDKKAKTEGPHAPLDLESYKKVTYFDIDPTVNIQGDFVLTKESKPFQMNTYSGVTREYRSYGKVTLPYADSQIELTIYQGLATIRMPQYRDHLFLPFMDLTNGESSYGGGRYIDLKLSDIVDGKVTIDFNKAYAPYCAYADGYACPIPPIENHLEIAVKAGEKKFPK